MMDMICVKMTIQIIFFQKKYSQSDQAFVSFPDYFQTRIDEFLAFLMIITMANSEKPIVVAIVTNTVVF